MHTNNSFLDWLREQPLTNLSETFFILAEKLWEERRINNGFTPSAVFNTAIGISGNYTTIIAMPRVIDEEGRVIGYPHKLREAGDDGYQGYYHQPGTLIRTTQSDPYGSALKRLTQEFFGERSEYQDKKITELGFAVSEIPVSFVWESFRRAMATRIAFFVDIPEEVYIKEMRGNSGKEWVLVENPHETEYQIIPFELAWLRFAISDHPKEGELIVPEQDVLS